MFQVLHSSAGAGKTHALVKNYLGRCLGGQDPGGYRHVLALTFTNKAAAEMKERVIGYLEQLSRGEFDDARMKDVLDHLDRQFTIDHATVQQRASAVLGHMLHHWSDVAISTIDAFTQRVVRPFARDLRLDHDLRMTTEQTYYREQAVDQLIDAAGSDERITAVLSQACLQLLHEERAWDPAKPLLDLSYELLKESSIAPLERLRAFSIDDLSPLTQRLNVANARFKKAVTDIGVQGLALFAEHHLEEGDVAHGRGGILGYFRKLARFDDLWDPPGVQALKPLETGKWNSGKASAGAIDALDSIADELTDLFQQAEVLRTSELRDHLIRKAVVRELLPAFALHELDAKLEALKQEDGVAFFSDLTRRVAEVVKDEPVPFIYERMGARYKHFLIDEFQDTSLLQWNALLPLIENALSSGGSALLVGDAKQAIYRWRNGEVRLFVELPKLFGRSDDPLERQREEALVGHFVHGEPLAHNRRSAKQIIDFNNALFSALAKELPESLRKVYTAPDQLPSLAVNGSVSVVQEANGLRGAAYQEAALDHALSSFQAALNDGFISGDVAILVRSKRLGRAVAAHFLAHGHNVISPDGLQLASDPVIQWLIELLRFLVDGEAITAVRVIQLQAIVNDLRRTSDEQERTTKPFPAGDDLPNPVEILRTELHEKGGPKLRTTIASLVAELARAYGIEPAEDAAVLTLLDEVHAWSAEHPPDIGGFLEHWERSGQDRSTAAPEHGAVQVMTVHKSKGLQFPVVIVPDASMTGGKGHGELFWIDPGSAIPELDVALVRDNRSTRAAELPELEEERELRILDSLNLLYVAFTRPERRLYALVPTATDEITKALSTFIVQNETLARTPVETDAPKAHPSSVETVALRGVVGEGASKVTIRLEAPEDWDPNDLETHRAFGTTVHAALEETRIPADLEAALQRAVSRGELPAGQAQAVLQRVQPMLESPQLAPWFAPHLDARMESTLIDIDGHSLRPDRLVFDGEKVRVLEFKTGKYSSTHEDQVRRYLTLLRALGHTSVEGAVWYLFEDRLVPVPA